MAARWTRALAACVALAALGGPASLAAPPAEARRVLIISSFGSRFAPFNALDAALRTEIARTWPGPIEFLETPLELARFEASEEEGPFAAYVRALLEHRRLDLVVTIGAPASELLIKHRELLLDAAPTMMTGLDVRRIQGVALPPNATAVPLAVGLPGLVENILRLRPGTRQIAVVLGNSPLERFWRTQAQTEFARFADRVSFVWWDTLALDPMRDQAAALPADAAILYGILNVDAAGVPHESDRGLDALRVAARAPVFGVFESQLGRGIVGGPLISVELEARRAAAVAVRILEGERPSEITVPPPGPAVNVFDWRELRRFDIPEARLPAGSEVRYRPPSLWVAYRRAALIALGVVGLQALLIAGLLAQHARRRRAEEQVRALNRRLMTAQEDERKLIARELHDDLSQRLARLSIDAARIEFAAALPIDGAGPAPIREELAQLSEDVHALAYQLHPSTLDELGLVEALRVECERFSRLESIPVALDAGQALPEPSRETALCLFRIAQEGLRNVARHAKARSVSLACRPTEEGLRMVLRDDGAGFALAPRRGRPSLGLASMRERAELIGGRLEVDSAPGRGTSITAWVPLSPGPA
jgi:signal transduction histidine kinase